MKKKYLKNGVQTIIEVISILLGISLAFEVSDTKLFILSKLVAMVLFGLNVYVLNKYGNTFEN